MRLKAAAGGGGVPGTILAERQPGLAEIRISYASGGFYNIGVTPIRCARAPGQTPRLSLRDGRLVLDLPSATKAVVPQRPLGVTAAPDPNATD